MLSLYRTPYVDGKHTSPGRVQKGPWKGVTVRKQGLLGLVTTPTESYLGLCIF